MGATRQALAGVLRVRGYEVREAGSGKEGLAAIRQEPGIRVVVLDLIMADGDGWWFRDRQLLDPATAQIPVVVFTAAPQTELINYLMKPAAVLHKPSSVDDLLDIVADYCGQAVGFC